MTFDEIKQIPDLQIEVTPAVEDAFHFLYPLEKGADDVTDAQVRCGLRLRQYPREEHMEAIRIAYKMIDNIAKYGIACADWA